MTAAKWITGAISLVALMLPVRAAAAPNIILITLDTQRADRMGFLGSKLGLTPNLDGLARHGIVFTRAYSQVPLTTASHATILTGTFPQFHGVNEFGKPLPAGVPYLPEILRQHGYRTAAFVGSVVLDPAARTAPGFDRGFDTYDAGFRTPAPGEDRFKTVERRGDKVIEHALTWLKKPRAGPFFVFINLYDAHDPYDPPPPYSVRFAKSLYDGEIAYVDACVGRLLTALRAQNLYSDTVFAIMADHGESLGGHGEQTHGIFLYDETIHVPLLFRLPEDRFAGKREVTRVGLVDVAPTLLETAGIGVPSSVQGESLLGMMKRRPSPAVLSGAKVDAATGRRTTADQPVYSESDYSRQAFGWSSLRALRTGKYLFIEAPRRELYDEAADPECVHNLASISPAISDTLAAQLNEFRRKSANPNATTSKIALDAKQAEQLGSLGYVASGSASAADVTKGEAADPKDKIQIANLMHEVLLNMEDGRYREAVPQLERILAAQPHLTVAETQMGIAFSRLKNFQKALPLLQTAVQQESDESGSIHYELGVDLFATGDLQGAAAAFEFAVTHAPQSPDSHYSLASVYAQLDRIPEAVTELQATLKLEPEHYSANLLYGRILALQGHPDDALPYLHKAAEAQPSSVDAHFFLADAYVQMNQTGKANSERAIADRLRAAAPAANRSASQP